MGFSTAAALVATVAATATTVYGQQQQAATQASMANYQQAVARNNQIVADQNAQYALEQGQAQEQAQRAKTAAMIGAQRAQLAADGIDLGSGSALNLQMGTAETGELDALNIRSDAARQAYADQAQGMDSGAQAGLYGFQAANDAWLADTRSASTILGGAAKVASMY
ncbi:MAG: hypothetical protein M0006_09540 [Magnetospirillum sp.]|nr:hypothetical protein [Magnetospirillum sp.]